MSDYHVLDLFCGLGGFSQAFRASDRWDVTTVDIEARFEPDRVADVFDLRPSDFEPAFDVVLASPPCKDFSLANHMSGEDHVIRGDSIALVYHALGLIRGLRPRYWFMENPTGHLRAWMGEPTATVTYCQYGETYQKRTDLWGQHPPMTYRRCQRGADCHANGRNVEDNGAMPRDAAERAKVPAELSTSIRDACERALDGDVAEQATFAEVAE